MLAVYGEPTRGEDDANHKKLNRRASKREGETERRREGRIECQCSGWANTRCQRTIGNANLVVVVIGRVLASVGVPIKA